MSMICEKMRLSCLLIIAVIFLGTTTSWAQQSGAGDFQMFCAPCHTIGGGRLVGPDLSGVGDRHAQDWLMQFVTSSQSLIQSGDADAVALFEKYNAMIMPDAALSESQIANVLAYITEQNPDNSEASPAQQPEEVVETTASPEQIALGSDLFQGTVRFAEGGPACNSCHHVKNDAVIGGGILARELTTVFSSMGREGVRAILGRAPFPVMQTAYKEQPLTDSETGALVAFLQAADEQHAYQQPRDYGLGLLVSGVVGSVVIFGICGLVWRGRKKDSVHQAIYDRQTKSS